MKARRVYIPPSDSGVYTTIGELRRLVRAAGPLTRARAASIMAVAGGDPVLFVAELRAFLARAVRFTEDPHNVELLRSPDWMLQALQEDGYVDGDCDDVAGLGAALGMAQGLPARFVLLAFPPLGVLSHVYTELYAGGRWRELDTTRPPELPDPEVLRLIAVPA